MSQPVAIITGASSGIGEAAARALSRGGFRVVLAARRKDRLDILASEIQDGGGEVLVIPTDLSRLDHIQNLVERSVQAYGQIDVLVNSAGYGRLVWLDEQSQEDIQNQLQVNLIGAIQITREILPGMLARGKGHIIHITSIASWVGLPTYSIYTATKFGLRGFLESLRREMRGTGITVTGLFPGAVDTEFDQHAGVHWKTTRVTPDWLLLSSADVAEQILKVIKTRKKQIVIPRIMWVGVLVNSHFPGFANWLLSKYFYRKEGKTIAWRDIEE
ncbi:MAG: SDR family oxidoreductase [Anaerolineales bacterium]|nr:SDR family oxidoreductase [Anaerolineales bacterium]